MHSYEDSKVFGEKYDILDFKFAKIKILTDSKMSISFQHVCWSKFKKGHIKKFQHFF